MLTLAELLRENHERVLKAYLDLVYERVERYQRDQPETFVINTRRMIELLPVATEDPESPLIKGLVNDLCQQRLPMGFQLADVMEAMFLYNDVIIPVIWSTVDDSGDRQRLVIELGNAIEVVALHFARTFVELQMDIYERQRQAVLELSTPVIEIWDGILTLPLIGTIDSYRARQIMEELLHAIATRQASIVLMDITGVPVVDTVVADHLIKTIRAARLLGAECMLVGIGPELAQTLVALGIDLSSFPSCAELRQGLTFAFQRLGLEVVPRQK